MDTILLKILQIVELFLLIHPCLLRRPRKIHSLRALLERVYGSLSLCQSVTGNLHGNLPWLWGWDECSLFLVARSSPLGELTAANIIIIWFSTNIPRYEGSLLLQTFTHIKSLYSFGHTGWGRCAKNTLYPNPLLNAVSSPFQIRVLLLSYPAEFNP